MKLKRTTFSRNPVHVADYAELACGALQPACTKDDAAFIDTCLEVGAAVKSILHQRKNVMFPRTLWGSLLRRTSVDSKEKPFCLFCAVKCLSSAAKVALGSNVVCCVAWDVFASCTSRYYAPPVTRHTTFCEEIKHCKSDKKISETRDSHPLPNSPLPKKKKK